ncbi:MAG: efflux transporter outer membrane subunit [Rhodoblastus sp.]|nr:efflux transporter outer membrane subunit [Rhodoblastus sp.]MCB9998728.1 efflux transporter outer membrane subunit [Methylobacteriaceae bacterium]
MFSRGLPHKARALRLAAVFSAGFAVAGCDLDWKKPSFEIPDPPKYRAAAEKPADPVPDRWADTFGSRELSALVDRALADNLDIAAAVARIEQADAQAKISSAALFPLVTMNDSSQRARSPGTASSMLPPKNSDGTYHFNGSYRSLNVLGLNASYELDFWGKNRDASSAARLLAEASRYDRAVVQIATLASLTNSYFAVLGAQDRLRIARENVRTASEVLKAIKARVAVGTASELDLAQQESVLATQRANIPTLEQQVAQTKNLIAVLVGQAPEFMDIKGGSLTRLRAPRVQPGLPSQLLLRRPDIVEAETRVAASDLSVSAARAAMFPSITLTGGYSVQAQLLKFLLRPEAVAWSYAAQLMQPITDGRNLQSQLDLQRGKYAELLQLYHKQIITAFSDVENALIAVQKNTQREGLQQAAANASRRAYNAAIKRLQEGTIDIVTLSTTQTTLFQNLDLVAQTRIARFQSLVSLYQALGGGWSDVKREIARLQERAAFSDPKGIIP